MARLNKFNILAAISLLASIFFAPSASAVTSSEATTLLTNCIAAINDPSITRSSLPSIMSYNGTNYADAAAIEAAVVNNLLTIHIASGSGPFGSGAGNLSDLYCGNGNDNTSPNLDATAGKRDYFFGGAGNDTVANMWESAFYGGLGNDAVTTVSEASYFYGEAGDDTVGTMSGLSYFYGGPGNDSITNVPEAGSIFLQEDPDTTAPTFTSAQYYNHPENTTSIATVVVNESATLTIFSGDDQAKFSLIRLSDTQAALSFITAPNFEAPTDNGANNTYVVTIRAVDGSANAATRMITMTVTNVDETSNFTAFSVPSAPVYGTVIQVSATVNIAAKVQFKVNGVRIPGCLSVATAANAPFTAVCNWKPARRGSLTLTATATPVNIDFSASAAIPLRVTVATRSTKR